MNPIELLRAVRRSDLVFGWFASWHTFLPVTFAWLLRRPSVLIAGGYDTARMPDIGYGIQQHRMLGPISRWVLRRATRIMTNSEYTAAETRAIPGVDPRKVTVVHHGVPDPFGELPADGRERLALSVGIVDERNLERKGLGPFARAAGLLPTWGSPSSGAGTTAPASACGWRRRAKLELTGWVDDDELARWYRRASVYVQPSRHEGFGLSVAEAMLAGCIPVYTRAGALPEVVGETGVAIDSAAPEDIAAGVREALEAGPEARAAARAACFRGSRCRRAGRDSNRSSPRRWPGAAEAPPSAARARTSCAAMNRHEQGEADLERALRHRVRHDRPRQHAERATAARSRPRVEAGRCRTDLAPRPDDRHRDDRQQRRRLGVNLALVQEDHERRARTGFPRRRPSGLPTAPPSRPIRIAASSSIRPAGRSPPPRAARRTSASSVRPERRC